MNVHQMIEELKNKMWMGTSTDSAWTYEELKTEVRRLESLLYGVVDCPFCESLVDSDLRYCQPCGEIF